ncbi:MAG: endonuclease [Rubricoccaceae bacterium]|nr:endonuclease [Rubricoccaceae bacterium]
MLRRRCAGALVALALLCACVPARAQSVPQYPIFPDLEGEALVDALRAAFTPQATLGYDLARDVIFQWEQDRNGGLRGVYSGYTISLTPGADPSYDAFLQGINTEHTWPQSRGSAAEPARSDLHHLFPTRDVVNSARSNHPFAEIPDAETDAWYRLDQSRSTVPPAFVDEWSEKDNEHPDAAYDGRFEPREDHAGNAARAVFYFYTIYGAQTEPGFFEVQREDLLAWHAQDPVTWFEADRNRFIAQLQGTPNPFILDTTLARRAYGEGTGGGGGDPGDADVWVNEIHYDNVSTDTGEGVEIAGPAGLDLAGWRLVLYNGNGGGVYDTVALSGVIDNEAQGLGARWFPIAGLQNGAPDGLALLDPDDAVVQFLSYEGLLTASDGPLAGETSVDIGVEETGSTPVGHALQLTGTGRSYADFTWQPPAPASPGALNDAQSAGPLDPSAGTAPPPTRLALSPPAPNPFRDGTRVTLRLDSPGHVTVAVYDTLGRRVAVLHDGLLDAGPHPLRLDTAGWPSGPYLVRATSPGGPSAARRITRVR